MGSVGAAKRHHRGQELTPRLLILEKSLKTLYTQFLLVSCIHVRKSSSHKLLTTHGNSHIHTKKLQHQYCGWFNFSLLSASQQNASYKHSKTTSSKMQKMTFFKRHFFLYVYVLGGAHTIAQMWRSEVNLWEEPIFSSSHVCSRDQTRVIRFGSKSPSPAVPSLCLTGPQWGVEGASLVQ